MRNFFENLDLGEFVFFEIGADFERMDELVPVVVCLVKRFEDFGDCGYIITFFEQLFEIGGCILMIRLCIENLMQRLDGIEIITKFFVLNCSQTIFQCELVFFVSFICCIRDFVTEQVCQVIPHFLLLIQVFKT